MENTPPTSSQQRFQVSLSRTLGLFDVTMIGVGAMIGAGIFGLTGIAAGEAGAVGLLVAFALNGILTSLTGLSYAELGAAYPQAGGGYAWVKEGLSRVFGFLCRMAFLVFTFGGVQSLCCPVRHFFRRTSAVGGHPFRYRTCISGTVDGIAGR